MPAVRGKRSFRGIRALLLCAAAAFILVLPFSASAQNPEQKIVPVSRVGASDYYYAVNKNRPDLLAEQNIALSGIQDEDPDFRQRISEKNNYNTNTNIFLTPAQEDWLKAHGPIRIGYRDDSLPFCEADNGMGELTGALGDYLTHAANHLRRYNIQFEAFPYASTEAALRAMKAGEIDCVFPVNLNSYDAAGMDVRVTAPVMKTGMNAVMPTWKRKSFWIPRLRSIAYRTLPLSSWM